MRILVLSDTHGQISAAEALMEEIKPDQVIHLGDTLRDAELLERHFPRIPICRVAGNNDWFSDEATEKVVSLGGIKLFLCHGHTTGVKGGYGLQISRALRQGCRISLFGHTHRAYLEDRDGVMLLNPGSLTYSGTYAVITLSPAQPPQAEIKTYES